MPIIIKKFLVFGDSLSDRSAMSSSVLAPLSGLPGKSPEGRFSNAYVWFEYFLRSLLGHTQVTGDASVVGTREVPALARTYCVGGATAYNYKKLSLTNEHRILKQEAKYVSLLSIVEEAALDPAQALALDNLEDMRTQCYQDNLTLDITSDAKAETLVIEWTGANDLITINQCPVDSAVRLAIEARIQNVKSLIANGYQHFVLFNLPELHLTPRFHHGEADVRAAAEHCVKLFNEELASELILLKVEYPHCSFQLFDVCNYFRAAYDNPKQYGFDESKKYSIYIESAAFKKQSMQASEDGYLFWDAVHPMRKVHEILAMFFKDMFESSYQFQLTPEDHVQQFKEAYGLKLLADKTGRCGCCVRSGLDYQKDSLTVPEIMRHGLFKKGPMRKGARTLKVMQELGWVGPDQIPKKKYPLIETFFKQLQDESNPSVLPDIRDLDVSLARVTSDLGDVINVDEDNQHGVF